MNDELKFKIIKDQPEENNFQKKLNQNHSIDNIFKEKQVSRKKSPKFLFLLAIVLVLLIIIFTFTIYSFFSSRSQKQQVSQQQIKSKNIYQIFFSTPSEEINLATSNSTYNLFQSTSSIENKNISEPSKNVFPTSVIDISGTLTNNFVQDQISLINLNQPTSSQIATSQLDTQSQLLTSTNPTATLNKSTRIDISDEPPSPSKDQSIEVKIKEINNQSPSEQLLYLNFPILEVKINELNDEALKKGWLSLMKIQKKASEIYNIKFIYDNNQINSEIIKNYFLKPSFIENKYALNFLQGLGNDYYILLYYTHTRKFPILIFRINNDLQTIPFMRLWDKESLLKDLQETLLLGLPKGNLVRNFTNTENYDGIDYKIAYFDSNYKLIWTIYKNYLIISTSLSAFKFLVKNM